jgi:hypothetical protein
MYILQ